MDSENVGKLSLGTNGRWVITYPDNETSEITSGDRIEILIQTYWIRTSVEHDTNGYYATYPGIRLESGLWVRREV